MKKKILFSFTLLMTAVMGVKAQSGSWSEASNRETSWGTDYATATTFTINSAAQLAQFAYMVNNGQDFSGKTVTLDDAQVVESYPWGDQTYTYSYYDLNAHYWMPIGTTSNPFRGTFNGNGKSVNKVKITGTDSYQGFFGYIGTGGTVQNLIVDQSTISGTTQVGGLVGYNSGTLQNCLVLNATISGTSYTGTIIGQNAGTATNCFALFPGSTKAVGNSTTATGEDISGAECLWRILGKESGSDKLTLGYSAQETDKNAWALTGAETGTKVGNAIFCSDGVQYNYYHYYKSGATATITSNMNGYDVTFAVSGTGASISGNTITVGTEDVIVSLGSKVVAEWTGSGDSEADPYIIYTREQLDMLAQRVNEDGDEFEGKFFKLANYISYDGYNYTPIGTDEDHHSFKGTFDGNGNAIQYASNSHYNEEDRHHHGLFGYIGTGGTVKNLQAERCTFLGHGYIGVIAGYNGGTIENCRVAYYSNYGGNVSITGAGQYFGTIAGYNDGTVKYCVSAGSVAPYNCSEEISCVGGIVGYQPGNDSNNTITDCLYLGSQVQGTSYVGAIVGKCDFKYSCIYSLYHDNGLIANGNVGDGTVKGVGVEESITGFDDQIVAKLAQVVKLGDGVGILDSPNEVTTSNPNGLALTIYDFCLLFNDSYLGNKVGKAYYTPLGGVGLAYDGTVPNGYEAVFSVDSENSRVTVDQYGIPWLTIGETDQGVKVTVDLKRVPQADSWLAASNRAASFSTTGENSITIMSAAELGLLAYNVNFGNQTYDGYTITLGVNDIDLSAHTWEPIGYGLTSAMYGNGGFLGTFDGQGHIIRNMSATYDNYVGLFSLVGSGATVKNIIIVSPEVKGERYLGVVAGMCSGSIQNCHVLYGNVEAPSGSTSAMGIGGIVGMCADGTVEGCTATGTNIYPVVASAQGVGGIVGGIVFQGSGATVKNNLFAGNIVKVSGNNYVGAIAGMDESYGGSYVNTITNNYYVDGLNPYAMPNTTLFGINGADTDGAKRAYIYTSLPEDIGTVDTQYDYSGVTPYTNGLKYGYNYYSPTEPTTMDITLSNTGDNSSLLTQYEGKTGKVTLGGRTLYKDGSWNTICLPFTIDNINDTSCPLRGDEVELWQLTAYADDNDDTGFDEDTGTLTLNFENCYDVDNGVTTLIAGYPYLIKWSNTGGTLTENDLVFDDVTITKTVPTGETFGNNDEITFIGTFAGQTFTATNTSILFMGAENTLYYPEAGASINAFRAYFQLTDPNATVKAFNLNFGDEDATSLSEELSVKREELDVYYDLQGRQVNHPTRPGIYIHGNRKVVVK